VGELVLVIPMIAELAIAAGELVGVGALRRLVVQQAPQADV